MVVVFIVILNSLPNWNLNLEVKNRKSWNIHSHHPFPIALQWNWFNHFKIILTKNENAIVTNKIFKSSTNNLKSFPRTPNKIEFSSNVNLKYRPSLKIYVCNHLHCKCTSTFRIKRSLIFSWIKCSEKFSFTGYWTSSTATTTKKSNNFPRGKRDLNFHW